MRHCTWAAWFVCCLTVVLAGPLVAVENDVCGIAPAAVLDGFSWVTPASGEASARVALDLPGPGALVVDVVAEHAAATPWVSIAPCGLDGSWASAPVSWGRGTVVVSQRGRVLVELGALSGGAEASPRLTLATRFRPAAPGHRNGSQDDDDDDGDGTEESNNEILPSPPPPPPADPHGSAPRLAGMRTSDDDDDDDGDGTEESNNEILPSPPPPPPADPHGSAPHLAGMRTSDDDDDDDGDGTEESNNEILPSPPPPPPADPHGSAPRLAGMRTSDDDDDDDGDGTEESNNEILPSTAPPTDPRPLGGAARSIVVGRLGAGDGPLHADHLVLVETPGRHDVRIEAESPVRVEWVDAHGRPLGAAARGAAASIAMSPNLPAGRLFLRVVGPAHRPVRYGIRVDPHPDR